MKKSQLRKIIRESIGELMKEHVNSATNSWIPEPQGGTNHTQADHHQNSQYPLLNPHAPSNGRYVAVYQNGGCENIGTGAQGHAYSTTTICMTVNGGQVPQEGQKIMIGGVEKVIKSSFDHAVCYGIIDPNTGDFYPSLTPGTPGTIGNFTDHQTVGDCSSTSCDTTPASACATQWFGNTAGNFTAWMASKDCSNYQSVVNYLEPQAIALMTAAPNPQSGPYGDWNAIKNAANASSLGQPQKGQFKRKMAKAMYAQCQIQACNC